MFPYHRVTPGQPLRESGYPSPEFYNDLVGVLRAQKTGEFSPRPNQPPPPQIEPDILKIRNDSGSDLDRGHVVEIGEYLLDEKDFRNLWFEGLAPTATIGARYAILLDACPQDEIMRAVVSGACLAFVNVSDESHTHAIISEGSHVLESADSGPIALLDTPTELEGEDPEEQLLTVRLNAAESIVFGVADAEIANGASGEVSVHAINSEGALEDTGQNITVQNKLTRIWRDVFCIIFRHAQSGQFYVVHHYGATQIRAQISTAGGIASVTETASLDNVTALDGSFPDSSISDAKNSFAHSASEAQPCLAFWNDASAQWELFVGGGGSSSPSVSNDIMGYLYMDLTKEMDRVLFKIECWTGAFPANNPQGLLWVFNQPDLLNSVPDSPLFVWEGNTTGAAQATLYLHPILGLIWRLTWVQCPNREPIAPQPPSSSLSNPVDDPFALQPPWFVGGVA